MNRNPRRSPYCLIMSLALLVPFAAAIGCGAQKSANAPTVVQNVVKAKAMSCEDAELSLEPEQVVAKIDGAEVLAKSLGEQVQSEEQDALREYCAKIVKSRSKITSTKRSFWPKQKAQASMKKLIFRPSYKNA